MSSRIVYIHGDGVMYWDWRWVARIHADLTARGYETFFNLFPDSIEARAQYWIPFLRDYVHAGEGDVLLGWSCGAVAAMRYAQDHPVRGLVLIAPYYTDIGLEIVRKSGFVTEPWDWARIRGHASSIAVFHSDDDPYISQAELAEVAQHLGVNAHVIPGAGHFGDQDDFPELREYLFATY